ncbi:MAG: putative Ig domain-containing protein [Roseibium sp.]|uniref:putative Ig domain-containing protein n=1 Tax=Roseibium sp. TaxID=1936156 RepID=UPI003D9C316B
MSTVPVFGFVSLEDATVLGIRSLDYTITAPVRLLSTEELALGYTYGVPADAPGHRQNDGFFPETDGYYIYEATELFAADGYNYTIDENGNGTGYVDLVYDVYDNNGNLVETRRIVVELREKDVIWRDENLSSASVGDPDIPVDSADTLLGYEGGDTLDGGGGDDILIGGHEGDHLNGGDGDDFLYGNNGADILEGGAGADTLIGRGGDDTAVFDGNINEFTIEQLADGSFQITRISDPTDTDHVSEVEFYQFDDVTLTVSELPLFLPDQSFDEDTEVSFTIPLDAYIDYFGVSPELTATQADGSPLDWLRFDPSTGTFSGTPPQDYNGTLSIKLDASGGTADPVSLAFDLVIDPVNDDPEVGTSISDQNFDEDSSFSFTIPSDAFTDVDGDPLEYEAWQWEQVSGGPFPLILYSQLPDWLRFDEDTRTFFGDPPQDYNGSIVIAIRADDQNGGDYAEQLFTLTIDPVNDDPEVGTIIADQFFDQGTDVSFTIPTDAFIDVDGDTLTLITTAADGDWPEWLEFDHDTGTFSGTPDPGWSGTLSIVVTAIDGQAGSTPAVQVFDLMVRDPDQVIVGTDEDDTLIGGTGHDKIYGKEGNDILLGGEGRDWLYGNEGDDILDAGGAAGDLWQYLYGGEGNDTYLYGKESGNVLVRTHRGEIGATGLDTLVFKDLTLADITFGYFDYSTRTNPIEAWGNALTMSWNDGTSSGEVRIIEEGQHIEKFVFADGTTASRIELREDGKLEVWGTLDDDTIIGSAVDDYLYGGEGNDTLDAGASAGSWQYLYGGEGDDTYLYGKESGSVLVRTHRGEIGATGLDTLVFKDLTLADITFGYFNYSTRTNPIEAWGNALTMSWDDGTSSGEVRIIEEGRHIEKFEFADGTTLSSIQLDEHGQVILTGTENSDTINAGDGDDVITGGGGSDILSSGTGSDTFVFNFGDTGHDTIADFTAGSGSEDVMEFDAALFATYDALLAAMTDDGNNTVITIDANTTITLEGVTVADLHQDDFNFV